jgi:hypothetical protein
MLATKNPARRRRLRMQFAFIRMLAERLVISGWIFTHFGLLSEQLPVADENLLFIKPTITPAPAPL